MRRHLPLLLAVLLLAAGSVAATEPTTLLQVEGQGDAAGDSWFVHPFEVTEAGTDLRVTLDWGDPDATLYVFLRSPGADGNVANDRTNARPKVLEHTADIAGTWEVAVKVTHGATDYSLLVVDVTQTGEESPPDGTLPATSPAQWWQTDGRVRDVVLVGDQIWLTGHFDAIRPPGTAVGDAESLQRGGLAVLDAGTGEPLFDTPDLGGHGWALTASLDSSTVYVGGTFRSVDGVRRKRLAAVDTATGQLTGWDPSTNSLVRELQTHPTTGHVLAGGQFDYIGGMRQEYLAALDPITGQADPSWTPSIAQVSGESCPPRCAPLVDSLAFGHGGQLYVGGHFGLVNGVARNNAAAVLLDDPATTLPWDPDVLVADPNNPNQKNVVADIAVPPSSSAYTDRVVLCGDFYNVGGTPGPNLAAVDATSGRRISGWHASTDGGTPACVTDGSTVFAGGHFLKAGGEIAATDGVDRLHVAAIDLGTSDVLPWDPSADSALGVHDLHLTGEALYAGGDFTRIGAVDQQGLARFAYP